MSRLSLIALVFVAALCLLEIESKEAPESVEIEEQPTGEEVEVVDAPKQKKDSKGKKFLKSAKKAAVKVGKTTKKAAVKGKDASVIFFTHGSAKDHTLTMKTFIWLYD
ncbi:conserved hypothetical protein [Trichinella spiralis]|uniref:hypothetical protein n=1 Tax=Trichinella spiralis TaxID=6334 RepID=UPI0001EFDC6E|nr:conserved hypothetical protein [Trichinella spiralis]